MSIFGPEVFKTLIKEDIFPHLVNGTWVVTPDGMPSVLEWLRALLSPISVTYPLTEIHIHCNLLPGFKCVWKDFLKDRDMGCYASRGIDVHVYMPNGDEVSSYEVISECLL